MAPISPMFALLSLGFSVFFLLLLSLEYTKAQYCSSGGLGGLGDGLPCYNLPKEQWPHLTPSPASAPDVVKFLTDDQSPGIDWFVSNQIPLIILCILAAAIGSFTQESGTLDDIISGPLRKIEPILEWLKSKFELRRLSILFFLLFSIYWVKSQYCSDSNMCKDKPISEQSDEYVKYSPGIQWFVSNEIPVLLLVIISSAAIFKR